MHTGSGGTAVFDVADPRNPRLVNTTNEAGRTGPYNDFIHHNADRPNASKFAAGAAPSVNNGNVVLVTEEDYLDTDCRTAGSFQTWYVDQLATNTASISPLDRINPVDVGEGVVAPHLAFCSAQWFDYHQSGIVAQGYYEGGLRLMDVRNPADIKEYGYAARGLSEVWDAYWVPQRNRTAKRPAARPTSSTRSTSSAAWTSTPWLCPVRRPLPFRCSAGWARARAGRRRWRAHRSRPAAQSSRRPDLLTRCLNRERPGPEIDHVKQVKGRFNRRGTVLKCP